MLVGPIINEQWKEQYKEIHGRSVGHMLGEQVMFHVWDIQDLCLRHKPKRILDFGCGKAYAYTDRQIHKLFNADMFFYDIGIEKYQKLPEGLEKEEIEAVICCDVLEHIPEDFIDATLEYWYSLNPKFVFATIAQYPATAKLADGSNAHVTVKPATWWEEKLFKYINCPTTFVYCLKGGPMYKSVYLPGAGSTEAD